MVRYIPVRLRSRYFNGTATAGSCLTLHLYVVVTLLASAPEVQYVSLRNINLILQKRPDILQNDVRVFFCKYNDPPYVKREKLEIMIKLCNEKNIDQLLSELKEYVSLMWNDDL